MRGRVLAQHPNKDGYLAVTLCTGGRRRLALVHQLVADAFLGDCPPGEEVCHGIGGMLDNSAANLSYGTRSDNVRDQLRDGTNHAANKTDCPRDHLLRPPNLVRNRAARGQRICLACHRGSATVSRARARGGDLDLRTAADRHYATIMGLQPAA